MRFNRLFFVLAGTLLIGCGGNSGGTDPESGSGAQTESKPDENPKSKGTIGVSVLTFTNPFFKVIADNITAEAAKHGYDTIIVSGDKDVAKQGNQVKDFIVKQVAAIVLCPCNSKSIGPVIQEANKAGIPVFTTDIACLAPDAKVECHIATDNLGGGREAGVAMIEALGESGGKVIIIDFKQAESCLLRVQGFKEIINAHNKDRAEGQITIVSELPGGGAKAQGYKACEDALQSHPDIAGVFAINDPSALGARGALEKADKADDVKIIGFDGQPEGKKAIKEGKIYADPVQFPDQMGIRTVKAIIKHFNGEELEREILIPTKLYRQADGEADPELKSND